jgi:hypothetical protein
MASAAPPLIGCMSQHLVESARTTRHSTKFGKEHEDRKGVTHSVVIQGTVSVAIEGSKERWPASHRRCREPCSSEERGKCDVAYNRVSWAS